MGRGGGVWRVPPLLISSLLLFWGGFCGFCGPSLSLSLLPRKTCSHTTSLFFFFPFFLFPSFNTTALLVFPLSLSFLFFFSLLFLFPFLSRSFFFFPSLSLSLLLHSLPSVVLFSVLQLTHLPVRPPTHMGLTRANDIIEINFAFKFSFA